jgi:hypothetical protein
MLAVISILTKIYPLDYAMTHPSFVSLRLCRARLFVSFEITIRGTVEVAPLRSPSFIFPRNRGKKEMGVNSLCPFHVP